MLHSGLILGTLAVAAFGMTLPLTRIAVLAVISAAVGYAVGGQLSHQLPAWQVISWALAVALPIALLLAIFVNWSAITPAALTGDVVPVWVSLAYLGLISQYGGFLLWYRALALDGVARTSQIQLVQPFFTLAGAAFILGEVIDLRTALFAMLILMTVLLSRRTRIEKHSAPGRSAT